MYFVCFIPFQNMLVPNQIIHNYLSATKRIKLIYYFTKNIYFPRNSQMLEKQQEHARFLWKVNLSFGRNCHLLGTPQKSYSHIFNYKRPQRATLSSIFPLFLRHSFISALWITRQLNIIIGNQRWRRNHRTCHKQDHHVNTTLAFLPLPRPPFLIVRPRPGKSFVYYVILGFNKGSYLTSKKGETVQIEHYKY